MRAPQHDIHRFRRTNGHAFSRVFTVIFMFLWVGCHQGGTGISRLQVGPNGNGEAYVGQQFLFQARLSAEAGIRYADVEIHPVSGEGWKFNQRYTERLSGKKQVTFAAEVVVPPTAEAGDYQLVLRLTDSNDITASETATVKLLLDNTVPTATDLDVGINAAGTDLHLESELIASAGIEKVMVKITGDTWNDELTFSGRQVAGQLSHRFHEHVAVGDAPSGNYRVSLLLVDEKGREFKTVGTFVKQ